MDLGCWPQWSRCRWSEAAPPRRRGLPCARAWCARRWTRAGRAGAPTRVAVAPTIAADARFVLVPLGTAGGLDESNLTSFLVAHRGNRVRILAISGSKRVSVAPDLPTAAEAGYPALTMEEWYGFFAAANAPPSLVDAWNQALTAVLEDKEVIEQLSQLGLEVETSTPAACGVISPAAIGPAPVRLSPGSSAILVIWPGAA